MTWIQHQRWAKVHVQQSPPDWPMWAFGCGRVRPKELGDSEVPCPRLARQCAACRRWQAIWRPQEVEA